MACDYATLEHGSKKLNITGSRTVRFSLGEEEEVELVVVLVVHPGLVEVLLLPTDHLVLVLD